MSIPLEVDVELWVPKTSSLTDDETPLSDEHLRLAAISVALAELPFRAHRPSYSPAASEDCPRPPDIETFLRFRFRDDASTYCVEEATEEDHR